MLTLERKWKTQSLKTDYARKRSTEFQLQEGGGQNTDPQSMDYPNGLPKWTTVKWTTPKNTTSDYILTLHDLSDLQQPF